MLFDQDTIRNLDDEVLTPQERRYLLEKFFPKNDPAPWKLDLKQKWQEKKEKDRAKLRWSYYLGASRASLDGNFRISHAELIRRAKSFPPRPKRQRVTDFTKWIYSLYLGAPSARALSDGKEVEKQVSFRVGRIQTSSDWELIFEDPLEGIPAAKKISSLIVNGEPMVGVPDVVFREKNSGRILIVERKATNAIVPDNGWPNLKAQLWAYSQIDEWKDAPEIILVGEVWARSTGGLYISKILRWTASNEMFNDHNRELFQIYSA